MKKIASILATLGLLLTVAVTAFAVEGGPSDVDTLTATAGDGEVTLSWLPALDDVAVAGYEIDYGPESVPDEAPSYEYEGDLDAGNVLEYTVTGLENGVTYYFSVLAYDDDKENYSDNYSPEASATPEAGSAVDDVEAPTVVEAVAIDNIHVEVEFSEPVMFHDGVEEVPEAAFMLEDDDTFETLEVLDAEIMDDEDVDEGKEGLMVLLTTEVQTKDANYFLTATTDVLDLAENSVVSGTSDTATFTGSGIDPEDADDVDPELTDVEVVDERNLMLTFNEPVVLTLDPVSDFDVYVKGSAGLDTLIVIGVELGDDDMTVLLTTSEMTMDTTYVVEAEVQDEAGNSLAADASSLEFTYGETVVDDDDEDEDEDEDSDDDDEEVAEGEAEDFVGKFMKEDETLSVLLSWTLPDGEVSTAQKIYRSDDSGTTYGSATGVDADIAELSVTDDLTEGETLWFKLTQEDADGNESEGVLAKVVLSETGPGIVGLVLVSLGLGRVVGRKKRK